MLLCLVSLRQWPNLWEPSASHPQVAPLGSNALHSGDGHGASVSPFRVNEPTDSDRQILLFEQVLAAVIRRRCISQDEGEDFVSWARERFVTARETIFGRFRGEGKPSTYLTVVILNLLRDFRTEKWGKWRPSAAADRLGAVAVRLEQLITRDGFSTDEAIEVLRRNEGVRENVRELREMAGRLPARVGRHFEGEEVLERLATDDRADHLVEANEIRQGARRIESALGQSLRDLPAEDRLILQLHIGKGLTVAEVSRALHVDQKPLYRRVHQLLARLRKELEGCGICSEDVERILGAEGVELQLVDMRSDESTTPGPSHRSER